MGQGTNVEWLARYVSQLLGERGRHDRSGSPPFAKRGGRVWQLDRAESLWLVQESGSAYRLEAHASRALHGLSDLLEPVRMYPLVTSATIVD